jgi:NAD(P)-dependent dehydrogenase (short-subunit alcohol dehydrogenase family)
MSLQKKVAIVTGGGQGIGKAIAKRFLQEGMRVVIAEIDEEAGKETEAEFQPLGSIQFFPTDISNEDSVKKLIQETKNSFDGIDVLVNNAARAAPENSSITELSLEEWNKTISINLTGAFLCTKHSVPHLRKTRGSVINIASTRALMSEANTEAYSAAKGGILALTHALAMSLGPDIRVNCISPGWIEVSEWQKQATRHKSELTEQDCQQHPAGRVGKPEDIASLAAYFASAEATFITGANFVVDGGMTKKMIYL